MGIGKSFLSGLKIFFAEIDIEDLIEAGSF
jgi:hypothetical protein